MSDAARWRRRYSIGPLLGQGGYKRVFRAIDRETNTPVAFAEISHVDPEAFERELALARRVAPEHVAGVRDAYLDRAEEVGYVVLELCEGPTLAELVRDGPLPLTQALPIMQAFARGLEAVHAAHVLHRDVKLDNAILSSRGAKLDLSILDFGLGAAAEDHRTCAGRVSLAGTVPYLAPEAVIGKAIDARADVYALGVCFYSLLVGRYPLRVSGSMIEQLQAIVDLVAHDLGPLEAQPSAVKALIARMLSATPEERPYMPEVVAALAAMEGASAAIAPEVLSRGARARRPQPIWSMEWSIPLAGATPATLLPAPDEVAPLIAWSERAPSVVHAFTHAGALRWRAQVDLDIRAGVRADLDRDGVRELYLVGSDRLIALDAQGRKRFQRPLPAPLGPGTPSVLVIATPGCVRLAIDGVLSDADGRPTIPLPLTSQGDGERLVDAEDGRGLAYNGLAHQAFRGGAGTAAAIVHRPGAHEFKVAHLERAQGAARVVLSIYGPGGGRVQRFVVADADLRTGDAARAAALRREQAPIFGPEHSPLVALDEDGEAVVVIPFLRPAEPFPSFICAVSLSEERELWRQPWSRGSVVLGDADGDGAPEVIAGDGQLLACWSMSTGERRSEQPAAGLPAALGDPFSVGRAFLFTASKEAIEVLGGPACQPGRMQWLGPRGDLWRSGALRADGQPFGLT